MQTLFPDKITENPDIVKTREVRKAEGFEFEIGDLVFELAKVLLIICKLGLFLRSYSSPEFCWALRPQPPAQG